MKNTYPIILILLLFSTISCNDSFFDTQPLGQLGTEQLKNKAGIEKALIATYAMLKGSGPGGSPQNWIYGDVASDDGTAGISPIEEERLATTPLSGNISAKWSTMFEGIERANDVLRLIALVTNLTENDQKRLSGEARFLRGYYYFELRKIFGKVPFIDENTTNTLQPNDQDIYPQIESDFNYAAQNLPEIQQGEIGRANSWAAKAFLAKVYLYQGKFTDARVLLAEVIAAGKTSSGEPYGLFDCYRDAFNVEKENGKESVFAIQMSINDGSGNSNGNPASREMLPRIPEAGLFYGGNLNATQNLVDAFKTDENGLPLFDSFTNSPLKNDDGVPSDDEYSPDVTTPIDPRLDWTVSRRGIPYLGWGENPGVDWNGGYGLQGGSLFPVKNMFTKDQAGVFSAAGGDKALNSSNYTLIRFADVLLWAAEAEVEAGSLEVAREYVNRVRRRAKNGCYVESLDNPGQPAANYQIEEYLSPWVDQAYARKAVRFERRLELGLEGHRFFDLVRWGIAGPVINDFLEIESDRIYKGYLKSASFEVGKNEFFPIPQNEITNSSINGQSVLKQNNGY